MNIAKPIEEKILLIIKEKPECRTNKKKLIANFLYSEIREAGYDPNKMTAAQYLKFLSDEKSFITEIESIGRIYRHVVAWMDDEEKKVHDLKKADQEKVKSDLRSI